MDLDLNLQERSGLILYFVIIHLFNFLIIKSFCGIIRATFTYTILALSLCGCCFSVVIAHGLSGNRSLYDVLIPDQKSKRVGI